MCAFVVKHSGVQLRKSAKNSRHFCAASSFTASSSMLSSMSPLEDLPQDSHPDDEASQKLDETHASHSECKTQIETD